MNRNIMHNEKIIQRLAELEREDTPPIMYRDPSLPLSLGQILTNMMMAQAKRPTQPPLFRLQDAEE